MQSYTQTGGEKKMAAKKIKLRTIIILFLAMILSFYILATASMVREREELAFRARYEVWQKDNPEITAEIKDYIDNVNWGGYVEEFTNALLNPVLTVQDLYEYYGVK